MKTMTRAMVLGAGAIFAAGCASVSNGPKSMASATAGDRMLAKVSAGQEHYQFAPLPPAEIVSQDLGPKSSRPNAEILAEAEAEFRAATEARERGDEEAAYQHYTVMTERLLDANVDPATFYRMHEQSSDAVGTPKTPVLDSQLEASATVNARVQAEIEAIQRVYPKSFQTGLDRSYRYVPYIQQKFAAAGLPEDLIWLAMVESQFAPKINSPAGAGGMWQFMRGTGRRYDLRTDWYVDDRYDWRKSTDAAIQYLSELYKTFDGNWPLAITAYNMGEGGLARAIDSAGGQDDLWQLIETRTPSRRIALETKRYYAKLLATIIVAKNPEQYGFERRPQAAEDAQSLRVKGFYSLAEIEKKSGIERGALAALNPQLLRGYTPPARETLLAVPATQNEKVAVVLASMPEMHPGTHVVRQGETLAKIASIYRVPASEIQTANKLSSAKKLKAGQQLLIPGGVASENENAVAMASATARTYTVRRGDSLSTIADKQHVSTKNLQHWNHLGATTDIRVGQRLTVAAAPAAPALRTAAAVSRTPEKDRSEITYHTVKKGEFSDKIAHSYGVRLEDLLAWNGMTKHSTLKVGQKLKIVKVVKAAPAPSRERLAAAPAPKAKRATTHVVSPGETASKIAKKYGVAMADLLAWNELTPKSVIKVGDTLVLQEPGASTAASTRLATSPAGGTVRHIHSVAVGEGVKEIASEYDVSVETLYKWNNWTEAPTLGEGDEVVVFQPAPSQD